MESLYFTFIRILSLTSEAIRPCHGNQDLIIFCFYRIIIVITHTSMIADIHSNHMGFCPDCLCQLILLLGKGSTINQSFIIKALNITQTFTVSICRRRKFHRFSISAQAEPEIRFYCLERHTHQCVFNHRIPGSGAEHTDFVFLSVSVRIIVYESP